MRKIVNILFILALLANGLYAQVHVLTGKVTDSSGAPIEGASITIKGIPSGKVTGSKGEFQIAAKSKDVLIVTSLNFTPLEIKVGNQTYFKVTLEKTSNKLDEVLVTTALGLKRTRNSLAYATQQVSGEDLNKTLNTNFVQNLSGKVAGLQITASNTLGGSTNTILRGFKSLTQDNQALFVVDGVPYDNSNRSQNGYDLGNAASDINPEDIESVSVLKGAAASALYGSRASNGVILINTKKGSHKNKGIGVVLTSGITVASPDKKTLPEYQTQYGQGYGSQGYSSTFPSQSGFFYYTPVFNSGGQPVNVAQTDVDAATGPAYDPSINVYGWQSFVPGDPNYGKATPWVPAAHHNPVDFFETPVTVSNNIYIDGGGENGTFKSSLTRSSDNGILPNSSLTKTLINFGGTHTITNQLTFGVTANYSDIASIGRDGYTYSSQENPLMDFREWWPTNVNIQQQKADYFRNQTNASWNWLGDYTNPSTLIPAYHNNLYWNRYQNTEDDERKRYFGNINLNYKITSYLNLLGRVSVDNYNESVEWHTAVGSVHQASYSRIDNNYGETNYDLLLNFDKKLTKDIAVKALLGNNIRQVNTSSISATTNGGLIVPGVYALANSVNTPAAPQESVGKKEVDGLFGGATISFRDFVTVDGTLRRDVSSTLPAANNTYYYPSLSANFIFSKFLKDLTWLSYGKLRANYAEVGGDAPLYSVKNTFQYVSPFNGEPTVAAPITNNNAHLLPEKNQSYEFGLEASFLKNRIGFDLTYYHAKQIDQIMPVSVSTASGYSTFYVNGGSVQNQGIELSLNVTPVKTNDFKWNLTLNWSKNINKVLSLYNNQPSYTIASYGFNTQLVAEAGKAYGVIRGSDYTYLNGKRLVDATGNYILNSNSLTDIGNINPDWIGSINNSFKYKNVTFSFLIDVKHGGDVYSLDMDFGDYSGLYPETAGYNPNGKLVRSPLNQGGGALLPGVTADGKANTKLVDASDINNGAFPFSSYNSFADKSYVYDASYVKLREVAITYSIPQKVFTNIGFIKGIDLSLTGRNLWIIHKNLPYADPEQGYASGNSSIGFQVGTYPSLRTAGLTAKIKF